MKHPLLQNKKTRHPTLLYLGRISPVKRLELLLEAVVHFKNAGDTSRGAPLRAAVNTWSEHEAGLASGRTRMTELSKLQVIIAGTGKTHHVERLREKTKKLNLTHMVKFFGTVSEFRKYRLFRTSWLHVQPSLKEGFGLTVLEAASQGTPTVAFDVPGLKDVMHNNVNGILVREDSSEALTETLAHLLTNKKKLEKLSKSSYRWSQKLPTWEAQGEKLEKLLERLAD